METGSRSDLTYHVTCEVCDPSCKPCGDHIHFETELTDTGVVVSQLESGVNYTLSVEARSGVSQFSSQKAISSITTVLHDTGEEPGPNTITSFTQCCFCAVFICLANVFLPKIYMG